MIKKKPRWSDMIKLKRVSASKIGIVSKNAPNYKCDLCLKRRNTTAHHIIPRRMNIENKIIGLLTIKVCSQCHKELHPENLKIDSSKVILRQNRLVERYRTMLKNKITVSYDDVRKIFERKRKRLIKDAREVKDKTEKRKIYPTQRYYEGKICEVSSVLAILNDMEKEEKTELVRIEERIKQEIKVDKK